MMQVLLYVGAVVGLFAVEYYVRPYGRLVDKVKQLWAKVRG